MFKKLYKIFDYNFKKKFFYLIFLTLIVTLLEMMSIGLILPAIYLFFNNQVSEIYLINIFFDYLITVSKNFEINEINLLVIIVFLTFFIKFLFSIYYVFYQSKFNANLQVFVSKKMLEKFSQLYFSQYSKKNSALLLRNVNNETNILVNNISLPIVQILSESSIVLGMLFLLFTINFLATLITSLVFLFFGFILLNLTKKSLIKAGKNRQDSDKLRINALNLIYGGFKELKVFNKINFFISKYLDSNKIYTESYKKQIALSQIPRLLLEIIAVCSLLFLLMVMITQKNNQIETLAFLAVFAGCIFKIMPSANRILRSLQLMKFGGSSLNEIIEFLNQKDNIIKINNDPINNIEDSFFLSVKNVNFFFTDENDQKKHILKNINLNVEKNSAVGIIGDSGSGKTTFFNLISGLDLPDNGNILNYKENIHHDIHNWRSKIGYVPQDIFLFEGSIKKNVGLLDDELVCIDKVFDALKLAKIDQFFLEKESRLNTNIGERGIDLSGGQRQRIGIARALYNKPELLILDEATSALNDEIEKEIMDSIYGLNKSITLIIISHKTSILSKCNVIYKMINGYLVKIN